jgi:hypothetical protein
VSRGDIGASTRRTTWGAAVALAVVTATALGLSGPPAAAGQVSGTAASEAALPVISAPRLPEHAFFAPGAHGYVYRSEDGTSDEWRSWDGAAVRDLGPRGAAPQPVSFPDGTQWLAVTTVGAVRTYDTAAGTWTEHPLPSRYHRVLGVYGGAEGLVTLAYTDRDKDGQLLPRRSYRLLYENEERPLSGWPQGASLLTRPTAVDGAAGLIPYTAGGQNHLGLFDFSSGALLWSKSWPADVPAGTPLIDGERFGWVEDGVAHLLPRSDPSAPAVTVTLPDVSGTPTVLLSGGELLVVRQAASPADGTPDPLYAVPPDGGAPRVLLPDAADLRAGTDGNAVVRGAAGGTGTAGHWSAYRIAPAPGGGGLTATPSQPIAWVPTRRHEMALSHGVLHFVETSQDVFNARRFRLHSYDVGTAAAPALTPRGTSVVVGRAHGDLPLRGTGETAVYVEHGRYTGDPDTVVRYNASTGTASETPIDGYRGRLVDAVENWALYADGSLRLHVISVRDGKVRLSRGHGAAALWGDTLWTAGDKAGEVTAYNLAQARTTATVATGASCVPAELQALGRWIYWSCGPGKAAGVYDRTANRTVQVPSGPALLGNGFVVRHSGDELLLTDVRTASADTRKLASVPATGAADDRGTAFTVDKQRGHVAWTDADSTIHIASTGLPADGFVPVRSLRLPALPPSGT